MQPFRSDVHAKGAELFAEMDGDLLRNDRRTRLEAAVLAIGATAWCAA